MQAWTLRWLPTNQLFAFASTSDNNRRTNSSHRVVPRPWLQQLQLDDEQKREDGQFAGECSAPTSFCTEWQELVFTCKVCESMEARSFAKCMHSPKRKCKTHAMHFFYCMRLSPWTGRRILSTWLKLTISCLCIDNSMLLRHAHVLSLQLAHGAGWRGIRQQATD